MLGALLLLLGAVLAFAAEDPWTKVRELKSGTELRIYKRGVKQPVAARMDELTNDNLIVVVKNEQVAISRDEIDRVDYRPAQTGSRVKTETKVTRNEPDPRPSSGLAIHSKPGFETIYRRPAPSTSKK